MHQRPPGGRGGYISELSQFSIIFMFEGCFEPRNVSWEGLGTSRSPKENDHEGSVRDYD